MGSITLDLHEHIYILQVLEPYLEDPFWNNNWTKANVEWPKLKKTYQLRNNPLSAR